ncbi:MAG: hypothetical protein Q9191_006900 [Dirinaria sp. TL-2023a]
MADKKAQHTVEQTKPKGIITKDSDHTNQTTGSRSQTGNRSAKQAPVYQAHEKPVVRMSECRRNPALRQSEAAAATSDKAPIAQAETFSASTTQATSSQTHCQAPAEQPVELFPSEAEFRAQIPRDGIAPYDLWLKYKHLIVNKDIIYQYEELVYATTRYHTKDKVLVARIPDLGPSLPSEAEVRARIPPNDILLDDLLSVYRVSYLDAERRERFIRMLDGVARYDKELDLYLPLPPLPSADELESSIPPTGLSLETLLNIFGVTFVDSKRHEDFMKLLDRFTRYEEELDLYLPLPPLLPSGDELMSRIPPDDIPLDTLLTQYRIAYVNYHPYQAFVEILDRVAQHDVESDLYLPLPLLPSAAALRSKIPPEGISVRDIIMMYKYVFVGDDGNARRTAFTSLLKANTRYDKERRLLMPLESAQEAS